jgi:hypothetical protein
LIRQPSRRKGGFGDAHLAADFRYSGTRLCLAQREGNLFFRKLRSFHGKSPAQMGLNLPEISTFRGYGFSGEGHGLQADEPGVAGRDRQRVDSRNGRLRLVVDALPCGSTHQSRFIMRIAAELPQEFDQKQKGLSINDKPFVFLVAGAGFEPTTFGL